MANDIDPNFPEASYWLNHVRPIPRELSPQEREDDAALTAVIKKQDSGALKKYFNDLFWGQRSVAPAYHHLLAALETGQQDIVTQVVTWGDGVPADKVDDYRRTAASEDKLEEYNILLRRAGFRFGNAARRRNVEAEKEIQERRRQQQEHKAAIEAAAEAAEKELEKFATANDPRMLPEEWVQVLSAANWAGAPEAVIAGGALRDTFNNRPVKDVDIFLRDRGSEKKNEQFIERVFKAADIEVKLALWGHSYSDLRPRFPHPTTQQFGSNTLLDDSVAQAWLLKTKKSGIEYNFVFMKGRRFDEPSTFGFRVLESFDVGLCQVGLAGKGVFVHTDRQGVSMTKGVFMTAAYKQDVENKTISIISGNKSTPEHLARIRKKYPDFTVRGDVNKALPLRSRF
jgi:hypothetical protein